VEVWLPRHLPLSGLHTRLGFALAAVGVMVAVEMAVACPPYPCG
jgi:hypothetical protein